MTEETIREIAYIAWKGAANAHKMYPDNKHTFIDYWDAAKGQFAKFYELETQSPAPSVAGSVEERANRVCVLCAEVCQPSPTNKGWSEVPQGMGIHFDCARKIVDTANSIDRIEGILIHSVEDRATPDDLQDQVREHIKQDKLFDWHEALTNNEMTYLENLLLTFCPLYPVGSIGYEKQRKFLAGAAESEGRCPDPDFTLWVVVNRWEYDSAYHTWFNNYIGEFHGLHLKHENLYQEYLKQLK